MRRARAVGMGLCLAAVGCSGGRADSRPSADAPRRVQVVKAEKRLIPRTVVAVGTLAAEERAELGFKVPGRLARWDVDLGSRVAAGAVLAQLDARDYELRRDRSRAALEQARARLGLPVGGDDDGLDPEGVGVVRQAKARLDQATAVASWSVLGIKIAASSEAVDMTPIMLVTAVNTTRRPKSAGS